MVSHHPLVADASLPWVVSVVLYPISLVDLGDAVHIYAARRQVTTSNQTTRSPTLKSRYDYLCYN